MEEQNNSKYLFIKTFIKYILYSNLWIQKIRKASLNCEVTSAESLNRCFVGNAEVFYQNSLIVSGVNQVNQSVARLIKLCDDLLILGEKAVNKEYVEETIVLVEEAVKNLVTVAIDKISLRENRSTQSESSTSSRCSTVSSDPSYYRISLPEIVMSPNELRILEETAQTVIKRHSPRGYDTTDTPPPKPPLPTRTVNDSPPPLPPKKRNLNSNVTDASTAVVPTSLSLERLSLKSDNSSVMSFDSSASMVRTATCNEDVIRKVSRERASSSSSSGIVSMCNSSHSFAEHQQQHAVYQTSSTVDRVVVTTARSEIYSVVSKLMSNDIASRDDEMPPSLPMKTRKMNHNMVILKRENYLSKINSRSPSSDDVLSNGHSSENGSPPPLPPKKKHIMAYMEVFGNCSPRSSSELLQNESVSSYSFEESEWHQQHETVNSAHCSIHMYYGSNNNNLELEALSPPPSLPPRRHQLNSIASSQSLTSTVTPTSPSPVPPLPSSPIPVPIVEEKPVSPSKDGDSHTEPVNGATESNFDFYPKEKYQPDPLAEIDVTQWLVFKRPEEDGPEIRGGHPDALIVLATKANKNDFYFQEAFLTTYRTFITPIQLIEKLIDRFHRFDTPSDTVRQRAARESFSLLVRVVGVLTVMDLDDHLVEVLMDFVYQLLCSGDLIMGKALRIKFLEKYLAKLQYQTERSVNGALSSQNIYTKQYTLLDFKSEHIAEQMTLLDAELFINLEIPEVLIWTQEQNEEKSPNLTRFTEHFNKMSFWARSRILEQNDAKDRERYVMKFIKIMKHLRKMNNFNSYLALLSALDSAPIRRLEWQKHITDGLKEYCALIDSSSSFRAYRQALAETQPPCIPYIGLVLQDLTFVQVGNNDYLSEGVINFSKRWQQFNIVENMKRFKKVTYNFKSHERIIAFFSNFDESLCEEAMWQISESIKPRGKKTTK